jgi:hypothetical protein
LASPNLGSMLKSSGSPLNAGVEMVVGRGFGFHADIAPRAPGRWMYHHTRQRHRKMKTNGIRRGGPDSILTAEQTAMGGQVLLLTASGRIQVGVFSNGVIVERWRGLVCRRQPP